MGLGLIFWILMLLWLIFRGYGWYRPQANFLWGNDILLFVLFLILGWHAFGAPIRG